MFSRWLRADPNDDFTHDFVVGENHLNLSGIEAIHLSDGTVLELPNSHARNHSYN